MKKVFCKEKLFVSLIQNYLNQYPWIEMFDKQNPEENLDMLQFVDDSSLIDYSLTKEAKGYYATFSKEKFMVQKLHEFIGLFEKDCWLNKIDGKTKEEIKKMGLFVPKKGYVYPPGFNTPDSEEEENGD